GLSLPPVLTGVLAGGVAAAAPAFQRAAAVQQAMPASLNDAVQQPESALAVMLALALSPAAELQPAQRRIVADAFGDDVQRAVQAQASAVAALAPIARLPLVSLAFPALRQLPDGRQQTLVRTLDDLVKVDGRVDINEYCLARLLRIQLSEARAPRSAPVDGVKKLPAARDSVILVCTVVAAAGCSDEAGARRAWLFAMQQAFPGEAIEWVPPPAAWQASFERALDDLDGLSPMAKELVIQALLRAVHADGQISVEEAELLRVICASLHCPLPL
ncbi:MAG: peptidase M48, partial [Rhodanobacter sp.]